MKSLAECLETLVRCAGGDGNLLFNVGPTLEGVMEPRQAQRLREMGAWLRQYGSSIYGTRGGPWMPTRTLASTRRDNVVYLHVLQWKGDTVTLPNLPKRIVRASVLTGGTAYVRPHDRQLLVTVLPWDRQAIDTIVQLELDGSGVSRQHRPFNRSLSIACSIPFLSIAREAPPLPQVTLPRRYGSRGSARGS